MTLAEFHKDQTKLGKYGLRNPLKKDRLYNLSEEKMSKEEKNNEGKKMPEKKFRAGGVTATVWKNTRKKDGEEFDVFNVDITRSYLDKDENWQTTSSFQLNDLPKVAMLAEKAFEFVLLKSDE